MDPRDHGHWQRYKPATPPKHAPPQAMFARRDSDSVDWYDYVNASENFAADTVKMTLRDDIVQAAVTDPTMLFPDDMLVLEVDAVAGDPQATFEHKIYDPNTKTFSDPQPLSPVSKGPSILDRIEALEARLGTNK